MHFTSTVCVSTDRPTTQRVNASRLFYPKDADAARVALSYNSFAQTMPAMAVASAEDKADS